jgi:hypothetical protein
VYSGDSLISIESLPICDLAQAVEAAVVGCMRTPLRSMLREDATEKRNISQRAPKREDR